MFHWYGLFIGIAVVVGWSVAERIEPKVSKIAPWILGLGLVGARVWHVIDMWAYYSQNLSDIVRVWQGGLSIFGGIIGGLLGVWIGRGDMRILSAIVTGLPLAQAIGRIGNGVNGEFTNPVYGVPWWGAEMILDLVLFCLIWRIRPIWRIWAYLVGYSLIRLVLQPYRM